MLKVNDYKAMMLTWMLNNCQETFKGETPCIENLRYDDVTSTKAIISSLYDLQVYVFELQHDLERIKVTYKDSIDHSIITDYIDFETFDKKLDECFLEYQIEDIVDLLELEFPEMTRIGLMIQTRVKCLDNSKYKLKVLSFKYYLEITEYGLKLIGLEQD